MNRGQLVAACEVRFRDPDNDIYDATYWGTVLEQGNNVVLTAQDNWPFLLDTETVSFTASDGTADLPAGVRKIVAVRNLSNNGLVLEEVTGYSAQLRDYPTDSQPGEPQSYAIFGQELRLQPVPQAAASVEVHAYMAGTALDEDTDVPSFPSQYHDMLVEYALAMGYLDDGNAPMYEAHLAIFQGKLEEMRQAELGAQGEHYAQIEDTFY